MPSIESNVYQQLEHHVEVDMGQLCQKSESVTVCTAAVTTTTTTTATNDNTSPHGNTSTPTATRSTTNKNSSRKEIHPQDSEETCPSPTSTVTSSVQGIDKEVMEDRSEKSSDCSEIVKVVQQQQQQDDEEATADKAFQNLEKEGEIIVQDKEQEQVPVETQDKDQKFIKDEECTTTLLSKILEEDSPEQVAVEEAMPKAKDDGSTHSNLLVSSIPPPPPDLPPSSSSTRASSNSQSKPRTMHTMMSQQQQALMVESGKLLEHLRKEVYKLRSQNSQLRSDFESLKGNNQRLMDANVSLGNTFDALNKHAKQVSKTNAKLKGDVQTLNEQLEMERQQSKERIDSLELLVMELRDELNMKQETYIQEVHSRLHCQKVMTNIVDVVQERCKDHRLVEDVLGMSDESGF
jgi:hypothetical protein